MPIAALQLITGAKFRIYGNMKHKMQTINNKYKMFSNQITRQRRCIVCVLLQQTCSVERRLQPTVTCGAMSPPTAMTVTSVLPLNLPTFTPGSKPTFSINPSDLNRLLVPLEWTAFADHLHLHLFRSKTITIQ